VFRRGHDGGLLWPGFGDNIRVIDWILGRAAGIQNKINKNLILKSIQGDTIHFWMGWGRIV